MILNNTPDNKAVLSNVGQISEFKIRNSAKAFSILSSGLYSNKIRAIIRELSCNAVDSHVAADKENVPFDVHLPNTIEPWFSIRDYGTGLDHEQVENIYTTYFESTKTDSNDFIGALGLGSKSPLGYTDNFTLTAIKNKRKGIYTAFINEHGVPSIALMTSCETDEPNGVEVKLNVTSRLDFDRFIQEAKYVYTYFKLRPVIHGCSTFKFTDPSYLEKNVVEGVHIRNTSNHNSFALMGNIVYPIDVPNSDSTLGNLGKLLGCDLLIEFNIGELDFQPSREHLSYIPKTIQAIKNKLQLLNDNLLKIITEQANNIPNYWDRFEFLLDKHKKVIWQEPVIQYINNTQFPLANVTKWQWIKNFDFTVANLASKFNISMKSFHRDSGYDINKNNKLMTFYDDVTKQHVEYHRITPNFNVYFVVNDINVGAGQRAKYHFKASNIEHYEVHVLNKADKNKPMLVDEFFKELHKPNRVLLASNLDKKEREKYIGTSEKTVNIQRLTSSYKRRRGNVVSWTNAGELSSFDDKSNFYYVELNGKSIINSPYIHSDSLYEDVKNSTVFLGDIYGVRKNQIKCVQGKKNWINLNDHIKQKLPLETKNLELIMVKNKVDYKIIIEYNSDHINKESPYIKLYNKLENLFKDVKTVSSSSLTYLNRLCIKFGVECISDDKKASMLENEIQKEIDEVVNRYPLITCLDYYKIRSKFDVKTHVAQYINCIDQQEKKGN